MMIFAAVAVALSLAVFSGGLATNSDCVIKGNVDVLTGERSYYLPRHPKYHRINFDIWNGDRWFCTIAQARDAGWQPAKAPG
ncbi:sunset domain-containing protein [Neorhizobium petrolearium]|uniref:sunset domain-containing protein n=1 Tax=Neorhizobium petrolearium TaxID=515361 RepID=UPI003F161793